MLMQLGTRGLWGSGIKRSTLGSGHQRSRSYNAERGHKNPFWQDILRTIQRILTKPDRHVLQ